MTDTTPAARCCDLHGRNCEPPSELCCWDCTEAVHPDHWRDGSVCSSLDLSGNGRKGNPMTDTTPADDHDPETVRILEGLIHSVNRSEAERAMTDTTPLTGEELAAIKAEAEAVRDELPTVGCRCGRRYYSQEIGATVATLRLVAEVERLRAALRIEQGKVSDVLAAWHSQP